MRGGILFLLITMGLFAQQGLYEQAEAQALADSVITRDEQALLDLIRSGETAVDTSAAEPIHELNQEGRWRWIYTDMSVASGLYGLGIPYVLKTGDLIYYLGFQLLAGGAGYLYAYDHTREMDVSMGRANLHAAGVGLGILSVLPVTGIIGLDNLYEIDPHARLSMAYAMIAGPVGSRLVDRYYLKYQPTDGKASLLVSSTGLGSLNGLALLSVLLTDGDDFHENLSENQAWRLSTVLVYGSAVGGAYLTHRWIDDSYTPGDASMVLQTSALGGLVALNLATLAELDGFRQNLLMLTFCMDLSSYWGIHLTRDIDFTLGDAAIVSMGTYAAWGAWQGVALLAGVPADSDLMDIMDIAAATLGFGTSYKGVRKNRLEKGYPKMKEEQTRFRLLPELSMGTGDPVMGFRVDLTF